MSFGARQGWRYGLMGLPLAFVALPLYITLPNHYAREFAVPLASLGAVLLGARLFDALIDPLLGRWIDRLFSRGAAGVLRLGALASVVLAAGFALLFFPPVRGAALLAWALVILMLTYAAYSAVSVAHQSWGARLGGDEAMRGRVVAWREGLGLGGVLLASLLPVVAGLALTTAVFAVALALGCWAWTRAPWPALAPAEATASTGDAPRTGSTSTAAQAPTSASASASAAVPLALPFSRPAFRRLLLVFVANGIASAVPATLVLFFIQDRLQAPASWEGVFLGTYFAAAALSIALWLRAAGRFGLARIWFAGMVLAVAVFVWAAWLGAGDWWAFAVVSALSGMALGADLVAPSALLAGVIARAGDAGRAEGAYFGWWNFATKLNLALAAGLALPLLQLFGYAPGVRSEAGLQALTLAYCALPCVLKLIAAAALYTWTPSMFTPQGRTP